MDKDYNIPQGYNSNLVQEALQWGDQGVNAKRSSAMNTINNAEQGMMEMLGKMQLTNERSIADRRMKALRSGMTSSGIAAMELQNIQAGQIGATQVMQDARNQRLLAEQELAGSKEMNRYYMLEMLNQNTKDIAAIDGQKYSTSGIMQLREEYPDASNDFLLAKYKDMQGIDLTKNEKAILNGIETEPDQTTLKIYSERYKNAPETAITRLFDYNNGPIKYSEFNKSLKLPYRDNYNEYKDYIEDYNKQFGTIYKAHTIRKPKQ